MATTKKTPKRAISKATRKADGASPVVVERIEDAILLLRGEKVLLDHDLAALYGVEPKVLNQAVKRNLVRFPDDFMFQLTAAEFENLRSQTVTSSLHGGRRYLPYAFTEHGVAMLSSVLRSQRAVLVNIEVVRAFVRLRRLLATHQELARKLVSLEKKYDAQFRGGVRCHSRSDDPSHGAEASYRVQGRIGGTTDVFTKVEEIVGVQGVGAPIAPLPECLLTERVTKRTAESSFPRRTRRPRQESDLRPSV